jgi:hypothetical protein
MKEDPPPVCWSEPCAAHVPQPGLSPYLHYYHDLRAYRNDVSSYESQGTGDDADLSNQLEEALCDLIRRTFE